MKISSELLIENLRLDLASYLGRDPVTAGWRTFAAKALETTLFKKYEDGKASDADAKALELFLKVNEELPQSVSPERMLDDYLLGEFREELYRFWHIDGETQVCNTHHEIFLAGRTGPGKSLGSEHDDLYSKLFNSRLTLCNPTLLKLYRESVSEHPRWDAAEKCRAEHFGDYEQVAGSKLCFAPKRYDISRTICVEPTLEMFYQLGFGRLLERRLWTRYKISLSTQPDFNRELARRGSVDGSFDTTDLSSASDSNSYGIFKKYAPPELFRWVDLLRVPNVVLPGGKMVRLKMVSTMGNGFTFPLETLIFTAVVRAAYKISDVPFITNSRSMYNGREWTPGNFGVFGDDIITTPRTTRLVHRLLYLLGYKVNSSKTFVEGPFRESCGSDFFNGHFVRGVYLKSLKTPQDRYVAINLLNDWSATTEIPLPHTVQCLLSGLKRVQVPPVENFDAGIHVPLSMAGAKRDSNGTFVYRRFTVKPCAHKVGEDGQLRGRALVNPDGLVLCAVAGYIRSQKIGFRRFSSPIYVERLAKAPCWGWMPLSRSYRRFNLPRWETAVFLNLYK